METVTIKDLKNHENEEVKINAVEPSLFEHDEPQNDADIETLKLDASTEVEQVAMKTTEYTPT